MYISASAPDAPPLSETTIGCFIRLFFWIAACIIRAIWSEAPPAPAATTISTGLVGSQAAAEVAASANASAQALFANLLIGFSSYRCTAFKRHLIQIRSTVASEAAAVVAIVESAATVAGAILRSHISEQRKKRCPN